MRLQNATVASPLFANVDEGTAGSIVRSLAEEFHCKGRQISGPADSMASFRLITAGRVKIIRSNSANGRELTVWLLGPGDAFDVVSLLDGEPHAVSAWALDDVRTLAGPMALWRQRLEESQPLRLAAYRYVGRKLREVSEQAGELALHETAVRLSHLLLRHFEAQEGNLLRELPQRELASLIGSVRIVVSRLLARMKRQGIVELRGGAVYSVDLRRLLTKADPEVIRAAGAGNPDSAIPV